MNSMHYQAIKQLAPQFVISARANDGAVEAIEALGRPFVIGVQWHPEWMYVSEPADARPADRPQTQCRFAEPLGARSGGTMRSHLRDRRPAIKCGSGGELDMKYRFTS